MPALAGLGKPTLEFSGWVTLPEPAQADSRIHLSVGHLRDICRLRASKNPYMVGPRALLLLLATCIPPWHIGDDVAGALRVIPGRFRDCHASTFVLIGLDARSQLYPVAL